MGDGRRCGVCGIEPLGRIIEGCGRQDCPHRQRKECAGCGEMFPLAEFRRHNRSRDGLGRLCSMCRLRARWERERRVNETSVPPFEQWLKNRYARLGGALPARRNLTHRQLERMHARGAIDDQELEAGQRYRMCWERAGIGARIVADYGDRVGIGETTYGMPATEAQAMWRHRLREANAALGVFYQRVAEKTCVEDATLVELARLAGFCGSSREASRYAARITGDALGILIRHFGIGNCASAPSRQGGSWHAKGSEVGVDPSYWESAAGD